MKRWSDVMLTDEAVEVFNTHEASWEEYREAFVRLYVEFNRSFDNPPTRTLIEGLVYKAFKEKQPPVKRLKRDTALIRL